MINLGQLIITGIEGKTLSQDERNFIRDENIGGVILFTKNYESPGQLAELINSIQAERGELPLLISVDHEGGRVIRFKSSFTQFPAMYQIASLNSPKLTYEVHSVMAKELSACGINLSFSPVCDIWTNQENKVIGDRSFGNTPEDVEKHISAAIRGLQSNGVIACAKHFPGHGDTQKDSHFDLPVVKTELAVLKTREFLPFIKASKSRVEMMMMAHLIVDAIDQKFPTTLSNHAYDLLRNELKFNRVIITDDMEMKAISDNYSTEDAAIKVLTAGTDLIVYRTFPEAKKALLALKDANKRKILKNDMLELKLSRVREMKKRYLSEYSPVYLPSLSSAIGSAESKKLLLEITEKLKT